MIFGTFFGPIVGELSQNLLGAYILTSIFTVAYTIPFLSSIPDIVQKN
jgi:hypothetical protein